MRGGGLDLMRVWLHVQSPKNVTDLPNLAPALSQQFVYSFHLLSSRLIALSRLTYRDHFVRCLSVCLFTHLSAPDPLAQVLYCDHALSVVRPSVINFSHFGTAEQNVFRADRKTKMTALGSDLLRHFLHHLWNCWSELYETWQKTISQRPVLSLGFASAKFSGFSSIFFRFFYFIHILATWSHQSKSVVSC